MSDMMKLGALILILVCLVLFVWVVIGTVDCIESSNVSSAIGKAVDCT